MGYLTKTTHIAMAAALACSAGFSAPAAAGTIMKCQDEEGKWHYGNFAAQECEKSVVTELNEKGNKVGENSPPPSSEVLKAQEAEEQAAEREKLATETQRKLDEEIVHIYGSEEVILSTRDRKLASIDKNLDVTRQIKAGILKDIEALTKRKQTGKVKNLIAEREIAIESYDDVIAKNLHEREKLSTKYDTILIQFREASARIARQ